MHAGIVWPKTSCEVHQVQPRAMMAPIVVAMGGDLRAVSDLEGKRRDMRPLLGQREDGGTEIGGCDRRVFVRNG